MAEKKQTQAGAIDRDFWPLADAPKVMEFRLINPTETGFLKHIEWNRAELEAAVKAKVAEYSGMAYTEETMKAAKNDRAELNKLLKAIEERRKKVKETINKPYVEFEAELKEVTALISQQMAEIDKQLDEFETRQREEKRKKIREAYDKAIGELKEVLPFEKVFDPRFLNKTYKLKDAVAEVKNKVETVKRDLETIDSLCGKYKLNAKDVYVRTLDLSKAMAEEKRLKELEEKMEAERIRKEKEAEERKKAEEERKRREEEQRREAEARRASEEAKRKQEAAKPDPEPQAQADPEIARVKPNTQPTPEGAVVDPFAPKPAEPEREKVARVKFYAIGSKEKLKGLVDYMKENGIRYGKVE